MALTKPKTSDQASEDNQPRNGTGIQSWRDSPAARRAAELRRPLEEREQAITGELNAIKRAIAEKERQLVMRGDFLNTSLEADFVRDEMKVLDAHATELRKQLLEVKQERTLVEREIASMLVPALQAEARQLRQQYGQELQEAVNALWQASQHMNRCHLLFNQADDDFTTFGQDASQPQYPYHAGIKYAHWPELLSNRYRMEYLIYPPQRVKEYSKLEMWMRSVKEAYPELRLPDDFEDEV